MDGPNGEYCLSGYHEFRGWLNGLNSLGGGKRGKSELKLHDGTLYIIESPQMSIEGLMSSITKHVYYKKAIIQDTTNGITCEIQFNPNFNTSIKGIAVRNTVGLLPWFGGLGKNKKTQRPARVDDIELIIKSV